MERVFSDLARKFPGCLVLIHRTNANFSKRNPMHWDGQFNDLSYTFTVRESTAPGFAAQAVSELHKLHRASGRAYVYCLDKEHIAEQVRKHRVPGFAGETWELNRTLPRLLDYRMPHELMAGYYEVLSGKWVPNPDFNPRHPIFSEK
jgi:hypothetical protein